MRSALNSFFTLALILIFSNVFAQNKAPGYLGQRFEVSYNLATSPATSAVPDMRNYSGTKSGLGDGDLYFRTRHDFGFHYVTSRRASVGLYFSGFRMGYMSNSYTYAVNFLDTLGQIKAQGIGLAYRRYPFIKKGSIAPLGPFTQIQYTFFRLGLFDPGLPNAAAVEHVFTGILGLYLGNNSALSDRILLSYGLELNIPFLNSTLSPLTSAPNDCCNGGSMAEAATAHTLLNFRLGISGLLF